MVNERFEEKLKGIDKDNIPTTLEAMKFTVDDMEIITDHVVKLFPP